MREIKFCPELEKEIKKMKNDIVYFIEVMLKIKLLD
ncbi:hypothetical protein LCGC14_0364620 [marine sediment metagenome]|uniref:Uncharacterized protein n=1 Tax=marine sediment metagenome TaxID=412755 RepID=A0A0F9T6X6_9ZZZZ